MGLEKGNDEVGVWKFKFVVFIGFINGDRIRLNKDLGFRECVMGR